MDDPNTNGDEPRLVLTGSGARVVLAEADAPGSLHYLLEAEGFQVVGCASDDAELGRVLGQGLRPDVIVLDADIVATSILVARQLAPEAHLIAVWPEAVQPPPGGERVDPRMVYEELGPAIRRHMDRATVPVPVIAMPVEEPALERAAVAAAAPVPVAEAAASSSVFARAASRMSVLSVTLITAILFTMGVSFALGGFRWHPTDGPTRIFAPHSSEPDPASTSDPLKGRVPPSLAGTGGGGQTSDHPGGGGDNHATGGLGGVVVGTTGSGTGDVGGTPPTEGGGSGDQGGTGDPGDGQGEQGGGQGDQGGGQGDQGGGQGDHGGGNQGGDHGGNQGGGDQGGGDQGGDGDGQHGGGGGGHGDNGGDDQGEDEQDDQGGDQDGDSQGEDSQGDQGPHGDNHGAHSDAHVPTGDEQV